MTEQITGTIVGGTKGVAFVQTNSSTMPERIKLANMNHETAEYVLDERAPFAKGTFVTEQVIDTVARWKAEVLREALEKALTWEGRLNEAEQMSSQGIPIEPTKIKIAVNAERNAAIAILEETK